MLRNTLILPADNGKLAASLLRHAIEDLDVVLMLVFGSDEDAGQIVDFADQLANKTRMDLGGNLRRVVWVRKPAPLEGLAEFRQLFLDIRAKAGGEPQVAVLNFHDEVKGGIPVGGQVDPIALELLFLAGHQL